LIWHEASRAEVWLGETGSAQCGGQPGVSDAYVGGLWWLDELGRAARHGEGVVVRQALAGANYGLLDATTFAPRPDYWNTLLWHRLMGPTVLAASVHAAQGDGARLRAYAHCTPGVAGGVTVLVINTDPAQRATVGLDAGTVAGARLYRVEGAALDAPTITLNGAPLALAADGALPALSGHDVAGSEPLSLVLAPASYAFVTLPAAMAPACL
jgi:hypothetical protein